MKVLITGAYGYIGKHVTANCVQRGLETLVVDRHSRKDVPETTLIKCDVLESCNEKDLYNIFHKPDAVIHLAWSDGFNHKSDSHIMNLPKHYMFLKNLIDSGLKSLTVIGSMHEVGYFEGQIDENTPCNPMSAYGISKNALRQMLMTYVADKDVSLKWLRAFYVTGDDKNNHSIFTKILDMATTGKKTFPFTSGTNKYDFLDIDELAKQIVDAAIQNNISGIINVCSGNPVPLKDKVEEFIKNNNLDIRPEYGAFPSRKYDSPCIYGNPKKIQQIISNNVTLLQSIASKGVSRG